MTVALETIGLEKRFDGLVATNNVSLQLERGARHALIGPNGAGKTTLINLLTGVLRPTAGKILLDGQDITGLPVHARVLRGISRTFQINQLYADLSPLETIGLAVSERLGHGGDWWRILGTRSQINEEIHDYLDHFNLGDVMHERTATLPYGRQRLLEIAVAIAAKPRVLLLDEHDMDVVFSFANRISVLVNGALFAEGTRDEVANDPRVKAVYLGGLDDHD
jgi:branched-chain amino acid transport system ATP-binding protein